jgi:hypothetical protein
MNDLSLSIYIYIHIYIHTHTYIYIYTDVCVYVCTREELIVTRML